MAFTIDWKAALVFVVAIPLLAAVVFGVMLWTMPRYKQVQAGLDRVLSATQENLTGVRVVRAFGKEEAETQRFEGENQALTHLQVFVGRVSALMNPATYVLINLATAVLLWVGALQVDTGVLTQGEVVALLNYMSQILVELIKLGQPDSEHHQSPGLRQPGGRGDGGRAQPHRARGREGQGGRGPGRALCGGGPHLPGGPAAPPCPASALPPGRGRPWASLAARAAARPPGEPDPRFYDATQGAVEIGGVDVKDWPLDKLREKIGVVPQKAGALPGDHPGEPAVGQARCHGGGAVAGLETAQAADFVREKPRGLDSPVEQGGRNFSGGQRQRLTIAGPWCASLRS